MVLNRFGQISIQVFFYIFMAIIFVVIIIFGFQKLFLVEDVISEQERIEKVNMIEKALIYCEDPLNSGSRKIFDIRSSSFNGVYVLGEDINLASNVEPYLDLKELYEAGDNVVFFKASFYSDGFKNGKPVYKFSDFQIVDSTKVINYKESQSQYFIDEIEMVCK